MDTLTSSSQAPIQVASARPIGASYEECSDFDKNLIDMRDAGRTWVDIRKEWQKLTGDSVGQSTLPNRYSRLKDNFTNIKDEDNPKLLAAKEKVEAAFERNKWAMIADTVKKMGGDTYGVSLQPTFLCISRSLTYDSRTSSRGSTRSSWSEKVPFRRLG